MIKVLIADDHSIIRAGLRKILERDKEIKITAEVEKASEVVEYISKNDCDVITLDINFPDKSGLEIIPDILRINKDIKILVLSISPEEKYALKALKLGAAGYLTKDSTPVELLQAIYEVSRGNKYISEELTNLISEGWENNQNGLHEKLSEREKEILKLIGRGKTIQQIAASLFISPNTVRTHRAQIMEKLNIRETTGLIHYAISNDLI
ncbi:MAG TPA: response regulator transcription factor [Ignavibacteriaceae bacterium]|nr:response regulator transcription factor [Ignavibacteriaceae bacterium]